MRTQEKPKTLSLDELRRRVGKIRLMLKTMIRLSVASDEGSIVAGAMEDLAKVADKEAAKLLARAGDKTALREVARDGEVTAAT